MQDFNKAVSLKNSRPVIHNQLYIVLSKYTTA